MEQKKVGGASNSCIGNLESLVHKQFAAVRVPGEDFVYSGSNDLFLKLDRYCDEQSIHEPKPPLLIMGASGTGKSALLSNWLYRKERNAVRFRTNADTLTFWHAVGCSRQSLNTNSLLRRVIVELKNKFELAREVPKAQGRLSWELPRFLDLASKKGKVILVIDGIHRLLDNDNSESSLSWLPIEFPPNVRVILSVTVGNSLEDTTAPKLSAVPPFVELNSSGNSPLASPLHSPTFRHEQAQSADREKNEQRSLRPSPGTFGVDSPKRTKKEKGSKILQELERRKIPTVVLPTLEKPLCRSMVDNFIERSVNSEAAALATGPYTSFYVAEESSTGDYPNTTTVVPGFLLFEGQITALLSHPMGGTPLFLRLFLRCLQFGISRGYSIWYLFDEWLLSTDIPDLITKILRTFEDGGISDEESRQWSVEQSASEGGLLALMKQFPWHPSFQSRRALLDDAFDYVEQEDSFVLGKLDANPSQREASTNSHHPPLLGQASLDTNSDYTNLNATQSDNNQDESNPRVTALSNAVLQNLSDQQWNSVSEQADAKLQLAILESNRMIQDTLNQAKQRASRSDRKSDYLLALVKNIKDIHQKMLGSIDTEIASTETKVNLQRDAYGYAMRRASLKERTLKFDDSTSAERRGSIVDSDVLKLHLAKSINNIEGRVDAAIDEGNEEDDSLASEFDNEPNRLGSLQDNEVALSSDLEKFEESSKVLNSQTLNEASVGYEEDFVEYSGSTLLHGNVAVPVDTKDDIPALYAAEFIEQQKKEGGILVQNPGENFKPLMSSSASVTSNKGGSVGIQGKKKKEPISGGSSLAGLPTDGYNGMANMPIYFKGGLPEVLGFGEILGNALALLYVSRMGLREAELWRILSLLQLKKEKASRNNFILKEMKAVNNEIIRVLAAKILDFSGSLLDVFKSEDIGHIGFITKGQILVSIRKVHSSVKKGDISKLLDFIELHFHNTRKSNVSGHAAVKLMKNAEEPDALLEVDDKINYYRLLSMLAKLNKYYRFAELKRLNMSTAGIIKFSQDQKRKKESSNGKHITVQTAAGDYDDYNNFNLKNQHNHFSMNDDEEDNDDESAIDGEIKIPLLGAVIEEGLLGLLCALGVMYNVENKVLILPADNEPFRRVINEMYIMPRGGSQYWHTLIIQFFQGESSNSLRKCEELPWHLKICRKWNMLKDTLVDLKTVDLMFNNDLRDELMEYWLLLTEGPLYVTDSSTSASGAISPVEDGIVLNEDKSDDEDDRSAYSHLLKEIDQAMGLGVSVKEARRKFFKNKLSPFDIVEEFNKSVEIWVTSQKPSPLLIHRTITQIAKFLAQFSRLTRENPHFLRLGIDMNVLEMFGVNLSEIRDLGEVKSDEIETGITTQAANRATTPQKNRKVSCLLEEIGGGGKEDKVLFPTPQMTESNLYCYLRWVWMQFPWIALFPAASLSSEANSYVNRQNSYLDSMDYNSTGNENGVLNIPTNSDQERLLRIWKVKHTDPSIPVFQNSTNRKLAAVKPRSSLSLGLERNVEVTFNKLYEELKGPSHIIKLSQGVQSRDKFRRKFSEEIKVNQSIPFAYHANKTMRRQTLFPSYQQQIEEDNKKKMLSEFGWDDEGSIDSQSKKHYKGGKLSGGNSLLSTSHPKQKKLEPLNIQKALADSVGAGNNSFFLTELDDEIRKINNAEYIQSHTIDRTGGGLITNATDLELETEKDRISRLKMITNKLDIIAREKNRVIIDLQNQVVLRNDSDLQLKNDVNNSELLISSLTERNHLMEKSYDEVRILNEGYVALLKSLKENPPYIESHVASLEVQVELAEKQFRDLYEHRVSMYREADRLDNVKRKQLEERLTYYQKARAQLAAKKKEVQKDTRYIKEHSNISYQAITAHLARQKESRERNSARPGTRGNSRNGLSGNKRRGGQEDGESKVENADDVSVGDDEDSSVASQTQLLNEPVRQFLNSLTRKVIGADFIGKDDKTLEDVQARSKLNESRAKKHTKFRTSAQRNLLNSQDSGSIGSGGNSVISESHRKTNDEASTVEKSAGVDQDQQQLNANLDFEQFEKMLENNDDISVNSNGSIDTTSLLNQMLSHNLLMNGAAAAKRNGNFDVESEKLEVLAVPGEHPSRLNSLDFGFPVRSEDSTTKRLANNSNLHSSNMIAIAATNAAAASAAAAVARERTIRANNAAKNVAGMDMFDQILPGRRVVISQQRQEEILKEAHRVQTQLMVQYIFEKTDSNDVDEFVERFTQGQKMLEIVRSQQILVDSRLSQLRAEHRDLYTKWSDISFISEDSKHALENDVVDSGNLNSDPAAAREEIDDNERYLDNKLFSKEVRLQQVKRLYDTAVYSINEVRTSIAHIVNLLSINSRLLSALPRSNPPSLKEEKDLIPCLSWCEDRITAINEALAMDANKPSGANTTDDTRSISHRQVELTNLLQNMIHATNRRGEARSPEGDKRMKGNNKRKQKGGLSKGLLNNVAFDRNTFISDPDEVVVPAASKIDRIYDSKIGKLTAERDKRQEMLESQYQFTSSWDKQRNNDVHKFLNDSLDFKTTKDMNRKANQLVNKRTGRKAGYGLVLENLLRAKGASTAFPAATESAVNSDKKVVPKKSSENEISSFAGQKDASGDTR